jgi:hypothetical protein
MSSLTFVHIASELESAGLLWKPEIGDEIAPRQAKNTVSILVDPEGMSPRQLRETYLWLPNAEQIVEQIEVRQGILYHTGLELSQGELLYKTVIRAQIGLIESVGENFRVSLGRALKNLLVGKEESPLH